MAIFWIASYPKSGNTWMRAFLCNLISPNPPVPINEFAKHLPSEAAANWHQQHGDPGVDMSRPTPEGARSRWKVQKAIAESFGGRNMILKTHNILGRFAEVPLIRPDVTMGALYILRDPRDVAVSFSQHFAMSLEETIAFMERRDAYVGGTQDDANPGVFELLGSWADHVRSWTRANPTVLRYEDMKRDPLGSFTKAAAALGMEGRTEKIRQAVEAADFDRLKAAERAEGYAEGSSRAESFFRKGESGGWREVLTKDQESAIREMAGDLMERFDYT